MSILPLIRATEQLWDQLQEEYLSLPSHHLRFLPPKNSKTFTVRNVSTATVTSVDGLKDLIKTQLLGEVANKFDLGYIMHGSSVVSLRSKEDILEVWSNVNKGANIILWCDGLLKTNKRVRDYTSSEEEEEIGKAKRKKKGVEREERVEMILKELKQRHGESAYTPMQYRVWAEMSVGGVHISTETPPTTTMFVRAGGNCSKKRLMLHLSIVSLHPLQEVQQRSLTIAVNAINSCLILKTYMNPIYSLKKNTVLKKTQF